jgi:hypothetical protein
MFDTVKATWSHGARPGPHLGEGGIDPVGWSLMSKKTKKKKARLRRSKANHGKRPNMGR